MDVDNSSSRIVIGISVNGIQSPITDGVNFANNNRRKSIETQTKNLEMTKLVS